MRPFYVMPVLALVAGTASAAPEVTIRLPERCRLLTGQRFDLRVEATGLTNGDASLSLEIPGTDLARRLPQPEIALDQDGNAADRDKSWTFRSLSFPRAGVFTLEATLKDPSGSVRAQARVGVQQFRLPSAGSRRNVILFLGDGMGTAYRDAARIVAQSENGHFRQGFFDQPLEMDQLPVSGMVMTYALDSVVPDSANTASAWATGNKTIDGALGVFPDDNDARFDARDAQRTKHFALDNPRIETLWEYLKRRHGYRTGIVTTADVTDATPAAEGGHTITRVLADDIARQFVDGGFGDGPTFDVILGGGKERFDARSLAGSGDVRDLAAELAKTGYHYVTTRTELKAIGSAGSMPDRLLGLFRNGTMNVAYDRLGLVRPADEPKPDFGGFTDQPFLDEMTAQAIAVLARDGGPFILLVEGASVDKQSHANNAAGTIWDAIELDKAVGVGRAFAAGAGKRAKTKQTLVLVTADHDQSMHILGVTDTTVPGARTNVRSNTPYPLSGEARSEPGIVDGFPDYADANGDRYPENTNRLKLMVGFRTTNHTGSSVPLTAEGPGALLFTGYFDQTDIFFKIAWALSHDTAALDRAVTERNALGLAR
jgi:alkaline phosphatase